MTKLLASTKQLTESIWFPINAECVLEFELADDPASTLDTH